MMNATDTIKVVLRVLLDRHWATNIAERGMAV
jgi:hypothetical protein